MINDHNIQIPYYKLTLKICQEKGLYEARI